MRKEDLKRQVERVHRATLKVIANGRIDAKSKQVLVSVASTLMEVSRQLNGSSVLDKGLITRVFGLLSQLVAYLLRLKNGY